MKKNMKNNYEHDTKSSSGVDNNKTGVAAHLSGQELEKQIYQRKRALILKSSLFLCILLIAGIAVVDVIRDSLSTNNSEKVFTDFLKRSPEERVAPPSPVARSLSTETSNPTFAPILISH